jgi:hypothetical protein
MPTRSFAVAAAGVGVTVLATTGITHASTASDDTVVPSVHRAVASAERAAQPAQPARPAAPGTGKGDSHDREGGGRDDGGRDGGRRDGGRKDEGRIYFNERSYSASTDGCVAAASGLGSSSFNIFNDSWRTVEVFRGFTCDNGSPVATVGPHGGTNGVVTSTVQDSLLFGDDGVVGSFRVISDYDEW